MKLRSVREKQFLYKAIRLQLLTAATIACSCFFAPFSHGAQSLPNADEVRTIAREAYLYANPVVDGYRIFYAYFIDSDNPEFKAPLNHLVNLARVYTHEDRAVQTPNSDTPYSFLGMDLRAEPLVLAVPPIAGDRYFSIQLNDIYTYIFGYIGSRTTGNDGGSYLVAGPRWKGEIPKGISRVYRAETEFALATYRTQLFSPADLQNVESLQAQYKVQPLSAYLGTQPPEQAPPVQFIQPLSPEQLRNSPEVFRQLNFLLQFCPENDSEHEVMQRFRAIGIGKGENFTMTKWPPELQDALKQGIADAWNDFLVLKKDAEEGKITSGDIFGSREHLQNNYLYRMAAAVLGIYGNSIEEAFYHTAYTDSDREKLDGHNVYVQRFEPDQLPPVKSFWSITMYEMPESLLVANKLNRYLLNSTMLDNFVRDADGGLTFYFQHDSPGPEKEANWLPAPQGPFSVSMRLYWPEQVVLDGLWQAPPVRRVK